MRARAIATLDEFFLEELSEILAAERSFLDGQRAMLGRATGPALRAIIEAHIAESEWQVDALDKACSRPSTRSPGRKPDATRPRAWARGPSGR